MSLSGVVSGILISVFGFFMLIGYFGRNLFSILFGIVLVTVGLYMIINTNKEDKIEEIKRNKRK